MSAANTIRRPLARAAIAAVSAVALLAGLIYAGRLMRDSLRSDDRYQFAFSRIECPSPPGMDRDQFLSEVRYYGEFPESVSLLDEDLHRRLTDAFGRHAWVERVDGVQIKADRRIQVQLTFREPALAVIYSDRQPLVRLVDRNGLLLPRTVVESSLPRLAGDARPPKNGLGRPWGNSHVEQAAKLAGLLQPHQSRLQVTEIRWNADELWLRCGGGLEVAWGKPADEAVETRKTQRLLEAIDRKPSNHVIDLRSN